MNNKLADFGSQQKPKANIKQNLNEEYNDDSKSDASFMSSSQFSAGGSSHFSSALKKPPVFMQPNQSQHDVSSISSQITYEEGFPNAERHALDEEEKAKRRKEEKEQKMKEFMNKTKKNAQVKLNEDKSQKLIQLEKETKEKERILKAKEYAKLQREIMAKNTKKTSTTQILSTSEDPAGIHTNYHAQIKKEQIPSVLQNKDLTEVIPEVSEVDEKEKTQMDIQKIEEQNSNTNFANNDQLNLVELYQRIDQEELDKLGVYDKQVLGESAIQELHEYSMLQRFRQNKDFKQPDKYKPQTNKKSVQQQNYSTNMTDKENKWWISGTTNNQSEQDQKQMVEKTRYLKALKSLVKEKGGKLDGGEIPNLCSCGALGENLREMKSKEGCGVVSMCASNCQFYKNQKDYEKALRDILHSMSLFK